MAGASKFSLGFADVVLVPFPFTAQSGTKKRPAVVSALNFYCVQTIMFCENAK